MGSVRNKTIYAIHKFVQGDIEKDQLKQRFRRVEKKTTGGNPHNIGMATFEFVSNNQIDEKTELEIRQLLAETFPDHELPGRFPEEWDEIE